jgi:cytoskeletal protein CcmA (bactofilin family)
MIPVTHSRRHTAVLVAILTCLVWWSASVYASTYQGGKNVVISNLHVIDDDLYVYTNFLTVEGIINGDLSAFAYDARIQGQVTKAINVIGRSVLHTGRCEGTLRSVAGLLAIDGTVGGSATALGRVINLNKGAVIERDFWALGETINIDGIIRGKVLARGQDISITGQIAGDVNLHCENLYIRPPAVISGNLTYYCDNPAVIDSAGVTITGTIKQEKPKAKDTDAGSALARTVALRISGLCAAFLLGMILVRLFRPYAEASYHQLTTRFTMSLAAGLLLLGVIALSVIILGMTLLSGVVGKILISSGNAGAVFGAVLLVFAILMLPISSFFALSGAICFYSGRIIVALFLGAFIMRQFRSGQYLPGFAAMFVGLVALSLSFMIPIVGVLVYLLVAAIGAGAILLGVRHCRQGMGQPASGTTSTSGQ